MKNLKYFTQFIFVIIFFSIFKLLGLRISSLVGGKLFEFIGPLFRSKNIIEKNDILLVKDGSTLGITNFVRDLKKESTVNSSIAIIRVFNDIIHPEYLYWFLSSHYIQNIIQRIKGGMGVPHLFQADIKSLKNFSLESSHA